MKIDYLYCDERRGNKQIKQERPFGHCNGEQITNMQPAARHNSANNSNPVWKNEQHKRTSETNDKTTGIAFVVSNLNFVIDLIESAFVWSWMILCVGAGKIWSTTTKMAVSIWFRLNVCVFLCTRDIFCLL